MSPEEILDFANEYFGGSKEVSAIGLYRSMRPQAEDYAEEYQERPPENEEEERQAKDTGSLLDATEALAYVYYYEHGKPIDSDETFFGEIVAASWPDWAVPQSMHMGGATSGDPEDYKPSPPLTPFDRHVIQISVLRKFAKMKPWLPELPDL